MLVETYHNVVCAALDFVCDAPTPEGELFPIPTQARLAFFNETRHAYGRTGLLLSGGAACKFYLFLAAICMRFFLEYWVISLLTPYSHV